jgi:hypothetical protein
MPISAEEIARMLSNPYCSVEHMIAMIDNQWQSKTPGQDLGECLTDLRDCHSRTYGSEVGQSSEKSANLLTADVTTRMEPLN